MVRHASAEILRVRQLGSLLALVALAGAGCHGLRKHHDGYEPPLVVKKESPKPPPAGTPAEQIATQWQNRVQFGTNPVDQKPIAGLAGRVYFFEKNPSVPMTAEGTIKVALFDDTAGPGSSNKSLQEWVFPPDTLPKLLTKDAVGPVYALSLPWPTYSSNISQVHLIVTYEPKKGEPLTSASEVMTLDHSAATALGAKPPAKTSLAAK
jgi:hypothetical protein